MTPENSQIEYLTTELNFTHAKIVTQDNTIKDLELKVKILTEKVKISEEKLNSDLHRKYFGNSSSESSPRTSPSPHSASCLPSPTCWMFSTHCQQSRDGAIHTSKDSDISKADLEDISKQINSLKVSVLDLKTKVNSLTTVAAPPHNEPTNP